MTYILRGIAVMISAMKRVISKILKFSTTLNILLLVFLALVASFVFYLMLLNSWNAEQQLATRFFQQSFKASIDQYEYLPALLAQDRQVKQTLKNAHQGSIDLSERLKFVAQRAGASVVYLMNISGEVIATSNHDETDSFLHQNYSFRPYFVKAIKQKKRQFYYAIGATTGIPGFFISEPVFDAVDSVLGTVVVKLDLSASEKSWQDAGQNVLVAAENSVIILSGQPRWRYKSIGELSQTTLDEINRQRQFQNVDTSSLFEQAYEFIRFESFPLVFWVIENNAYLVSSFPIPDTGWTLFYLEKNRRFIQSSFIFFIVVLTGLSLAFLYYRERQSKLRSRWQAEQAVLKLNESLEAQVESRTRDLRDAQAELVRQGKAAALGQMAATIVHELSQPLSAMNSSIGATQLKAGKNDWEGTLKSIGRLTPLVEKMNNVIKLLKFFSYQDDKSIQNQELAPLIEQSLMLYKDKLKEKRVALNLNNLEPSVLVKVNPLKLDMVIVNIIQNAIDAMANCESPTISIAMETRQDQAIISIEDQGGGINSRVMGQLFDPYFTTKEIGKGLGLGLSICHEIIQEYNGQIVAENTEHGARFIISLPLAEAKSRQA